jgi:hypothetical protein
MADLIFTRGLYLVNNHTIDLTDGATVLRALLERSTSTWAPDRDNHFLSNATGLVEISAGGYGRVTITGKSVVEDDANDRGRFTFDEVNFGALDPGQTVKSVVIYQQVGGDDSTPADDVLIARLDTGFPWTLGGADEFIVELAAAGLWVFKQDTA